MISGDSCFHRDHREFRFLSTRFVRELAGSHSKGFFHIFGVWRVCGLEVLCEEETRLWGFAM